MLGSGYGFGTIPHEPYEEVIPCLKEALKAEGFGVLIEIYVRQTLREKLGAEMEPYLILGACNPVLAHQALALEPGIGLLLPCNVMVRATGFVDVTKGALLFFSFLGASVKRSLTHADRGLLLVISRALAPGA